MRNSTPGSTPVDPQLRGNILGVWKKDGCKLTRCYTSQAQICGVLLGVPGDYRGVGLAEEVRYEGLRKGREKGLDGEVVEFFRGLGMYEPMGGST